MTNPRRTPRWPHLRTVLCLITAITAIATAVYATNTIAVPSRAVQPAAATNAIFPCDVQNLIQQAQQVASHPESLPNDPGSLLRGLKDLLGSCGIDTTPEEQFLRQAAAAVTPQQLTADFEQYLVDEQHVDRADITQLEVEVQHVMADPTQVGDLAGGLLDQIRKHGVLIAVAVAVVVVALLIFGAASGKGEKRGGTVPLFKAPSSGKGQRWYKQGFRASDFPGRPGEIPDGNAYFAKDRQIADEFAKSYGEGVIEVIIPSDVYRRTYQKFEDNNYDGRGLTEVIIPAGTVEQLNIYPRVWHQ